MEQMLLWLGRAVGLAGVALCLFALVSRFSGSYWAGGFQVGTLLQGGIAGMCFACLCLLCVLVQRNGRR